MVEKERLRAALRETVPRIDWDAERPLGEDGLLDSLDLLMVVARLHTEFQMELPPQELTAANFHSLDAIWELCKRNAGKKQNATVKRLV